jgi:hypothetical protein
VAGARERSRLSAGLVDDVSFWPYLVIVLGSAPAALAAGLAARGVVFVRSGEREAAPLLETAGGFWEAPVFRPWLALRNSALAAIPVFGVAGFFAFVTYFATARRPTGWGVIAFLGWLVLIVRLCWAVTKRTVVARSLDDARVQVSPALPAPGVPFRVRVEQPARRHVRIWSLEAELVCDRTVTKWPRHGKRRTRKDEVFRQRQVLASDVLAQPNLPARGECAFSVPAAAFTNEGWAAWRIEVRTRLSGPNYHSRFPLAPDDIEDDGEEEP